MFRKLICICLLFITVHADAHPILHSYNELLSSLQEGNTVKAIFDVNRCQLQKSTFNAPAKGMGSISFTIFNNYPVRKDDVMQMAIATSTTMLIEHGTFGLVYGYLRLRAFENGLVEIDNKFYDAKTYEEKGSVHYSCQLNDGSVKLFQTD